MTDDECTALAGEYVLGTLSAADRRRVERLRVDDARLAREIEAWETRLAPLSQTLEEVPAGLSEVYASNFRRAFHRWRGMPPSHLRESR